MRDILNRFLGAEGGQVIQMIGALLVVVVLIVLFAWAMRRFGAGGRKQPAARGGRPTQRLAVVDAAHVDGQRRLVLVRRDDVEHLVMIGGPNDVLIEPRIVRGQPLGGQRAAPQAVPYPTAAVPGAPNVAAPQPQQVRATAQQPQPGQAPTVQPHTGQPHTGQPQQAPAATAAPGQVPMPPPFVEPVTSPAAPHRANPIAADLRAAMGDGRRADDYADTQRDGYAGRQPTAPQSGTRQQPAAAHGAYDEPTVAAPRPYAGEPAPYVAPPRPAASTRQSSAPSSGSAPSLEDMVAAGLEQAISRPDPAPTRSGRGQGPAFGQRVEPSAYDTRTPAKDAVAAEIEKAIYGLTAPGAPAARPQSASRQQPQRRDERQDRHQDRHEPEATVAISRMPQATTPVFPRPQPATLRPTLVAQQDAEPVVAVLPQPDAVRADGRADPRRSSSDIEDEMARLLSELTGTAGR